MSLVDLTDTELLEESGISKSWWTLSAASTDRADKLGIWWLGRFEKIGTLNGPDVLQHKDHNEVFCCYNCDEGWWQMQTTGFLLMFAKDVDATSCHKPAMHGWLVDNGVNAGVTLVCDDDEDGVVGQPHKKNRLMENQMPMVPTPPPAPPPAAMLDGKGSGKGKGPYKDKANTNPPVKRGGWMSKYSALAGAVQTDWAEAQQLAHEFTSDGEWFKACVLLISAILKDNRGDAHAIIAHYNIE